MKMLNTKSLLLGVLAGLLMIPTPISAKYDVTVSSVIDTLGIPLLVVTHDESWTNKDVVVEVNALPSNGRKIESVILPNGSVVNTPTFTYTVSENGVYTFRAVDESGAWGYGSAVVKNIDRGKPSAELETPKDWVREDPLMDVKGIK